MGLDCIFPIEVRTHTCDYVQAAFLGGPATLAKEIPVAEEHWP
jgi:hypothetical protein